MEREGGASGLSRSGCDTPVSDVDDTAPIGAKTDFGYLIGSHIFAAGIDNIISSNARDFSVFGCFTIIQPW